MWAFLLPPVGVALRGAPLPIVLINLLFTLLGRYFCVYKNVLVRVLGEILRDLYSMGTDKGGPRVSHFSPALLNI
jgi:hypothetical protein